MSFSVFIHNKHNSDWSDASYENVFNFRNSNEMNIKKMIENFENCNIIDYDIFITKNNILPNNENNFGTYKIDISIMDNQDRVIQTFKNIYNFLIQNNFYIVNDKNGFRYEFRYIGIILKDDLCCIRLNVKKFDDYIKNLLISKGNLLENDKVFSFFIKNEKQNKRSERFRYDHYKKQFHN